MVSRFHCCYLLWTIPERQRQENYEPDVFLVDVQDLINVDLKAGALDHWKGTEKPLSSSPDKDRNSDSNYRSASPGSRQHLKTGTSIESEENSPVPVMKLPITKR